MPRANKELPAPESRDADQNEPVGAEIVLPDRSEEVAGLQEMLARMVEQKVAEVMQSESASFEPFFQPKRIADAIKRLQTVDEQHVHSYYFADYGCRICNRRDVRHAALGMCAKCYRIQAYRNTVALRRNAPPRQSETTFVDTMKLAQQALVPLLRDLGRSSEAAPESLQEYTQLDQSTHGG